MRGTLAILLVLASAGSAAAQAGDDAAKLPPGQLGREPTAIPGHFLKNRTVTPRKPDVQVPLGDRTSVGAYQESGRVDPHVLSPARQPRDVGAGLTLQHRFGGP